MVRERRPTDVGSDRRGQGKTTGRFVSGGTETRGYRRRLGTETSDSFPVSRDDLGQEPQLDVQGNVYQNKQLKRGLKGLSTYSRQRMVPGPDT